jgi:UrcA family protein
MFKSIAKFALVVLGALTVSSFAATASKAESATLLPTVTVSYADLNLKTPVGVEALYARLRAASRSVCNVGRAHGLVEAAAAKSCYREVLETAVGNANVPTLTARHLVAGAREG